MKRKKRNARKKKKKHACAECKRLFKCLYTCHKCKKMFCDNHVEYDFLSKGWVCENCKK